MRINRPISFGPHYVNEIDDGVCTIQRHQLFHLQPRDSTQGKLTQEDETVLMRRQRLEACFVALLQGEKMYRDDRMQVKCTGAGKLCWRLLSGPLEGCTLYVCWDVDTIAIDFSAPTALADRLLGIQNKLEQRFNSPLQTRSITVKVTRESGFI